MFKAKITQCRNIIMQGEELGRLMALNDHMNSGQLARLMTDQGYEWYYNKARRLKKLLFFELHPNEMEALLKCLNASSIGIKQQNPKETE